MKKIISVLLTVPAFIYASSACADNGWYLGALYNAQDVSIPDRDFNTAGIIAGYQYNKYLAVEARIATGTSGYSYSYPDIGEPEVSYKEDIDTQSLLLIKASYPVFGSLSIVGLVGYTDTKFEISGVGQAGLQDGSIVEDFVYEGTYSENGFSYGLGLNYQVNNNFNVFIDYQVLPDFEPISIISESWRSTTIGVNYIF